MEQVHLVGLEREDMDKLASVVDWLAVLFHLIRNNQQLINNWSLQVTFTLEQHKNVGGN